MNGKLFLIHWKAAEAEALAAPLRADGWQVELEAEDGARAGKLIRESPPDVIVIYLTRLPSHGRATASYLRSAKATRHLPIIFVDGTEEVIARVKTSVPDALYVTSSALPETLQHFSAEGRGRKAPFPPS